MDEQDFRKLPLKREPVLVEREKSYGSFQLQGGWAQYMKGEVRKTPGHPRLRGDQREALDMILTKISRLLHGDVKHKDTWDDIAGYAKLGSEACE